MYTQNEKKIILKIYLYFNIFNINIFSFFRKKNIKRSCGDEKTNP
jgi:hypothetical protein